MISTDTSANVIESAELSHACVTAGLRDSRTVALHWLSIYLAVSGAVLAGGARWALVALHVALIVVAEVAILPRGSRIVGDLLPLVAAPLLYGEIPSLIAALGTSYHDAAIQALELSLFGTQPSRALAAAFPYRTLSETLHAGYLAYYPAIFLPPLLLLARGERRAFAHTVLALTATYTLCWVWFALMPVQGPRYLWIPDHAPDGPVRRLAVGILAAGSSRGAAFPSSHMAIAVVQALAAAKWQRRLAPTLAVVAMSIGVGAVYGGFHYAVDVIAGALTGVVVWWFVSAMFAGDSHRAALRRVE
jgi:membrane-associated phospholipid phosphatase